MTTKYYQSLLLLLCSLLLYPVDCAPQKLYEGSACTLSTGVKGVCTLFDKCEQAVRNFPSGIKPKSCGFSGRHLLVCCEEIRYEASSSKSEEACSSYSKGAPLILGNQVIRGVEAEFGEFPHMAALGSVWKGSDTISWDCGGTLISERYVLTAAHCTSGRLRQLIKVRLGGVNLAAQNYEWQEYGVEKNIRHPKYRQNYNDIALVRLNRNVNFSKTIWPACLYTNLTEPKEELIVTGWGATDPLGEIQSEILMKATVSLTALQKCNKSDAITKKLKSGVDRNMVCSSNERDTCDGDSGGPLQILTGNENTVYYVVGVTNFGPSPCGGAAPAIYANVSSYVPWIESIVWPA